MYSKDNFIIPINNDITLKLRNTLGKITHIIREPQCTISQNSNSLIIKQKSESNKISLNFNTHIEATQAHNLLRIALKQLEFNISSINSATFLTITIDAINTDTGTDTEIPIPTNISQLYNLYVNGVLIFNENYENYELLQLPTRLLWKNDAIYQLDTDDIITINYL